MTKRKIKIRDPEYDTRNDHEVVLTTEFDAALSHSNVEGFTTAELRELSDAIAVRLGNPALASSGERWRKPEEQGDLLIATVNPWLDVVVDEARCVVLRVPGCRITLSSVGALTEALGAALSRKEELLTEAESERPGR
jgi:hypothetical protein